MNRRGFIALPLLIFAVAVAAGAVGWWGYNIAPFSGVVDKKTTVSEKENFDGIVKLLFPSGGESWKLGSMQKIKWLLGSSAETSTVSLQVGEYSPKHGESPRGYFIGFRSGEEPSYTPGIASDVGENEYEWVVGDADSPFLGNMRSAFEGPFAVDIEEKSYVMSVCVFNTEYSPYTAFQGCNKSDAFTVVK